MAGGEFAVVVENGLLRPERTLGYPDNTRLVIRIERIEQDRQSEAAARAALHEFRASGDLKLGGWHPTRDEMHERD